MRVVFRCQCGRLVAVRATTSSATCPNCRQVVRPVGIRFNWIVVILVGIFIPTVGLLSTARPNPRLSSTLPPPPGVEQSRPEPEHRIPAIPDAAHVSEIPPPIQHNPPPKPAIAENPRTGILQPVVPKPGRFQAGDTVDQLVTVTRRSMAVTLGIQVGQGAEYTIGSEFRITDVHADGSLSAEQVIRSTTLIRADPDLKDALARGLRASHGTKFKLKVGPNGRITSFQGVADPIQIQAKREVAVQTFRAWSILDADAWKELAGITFFVPERPLARGAKWSHDLAHDWVPFGSWRGKTGYTAVGPEPTMRGAERIEYTHSLTYHPPVTPSRIGLPLEVLRAEFQPVVARGVIAFDPRTQRTVAAEELFRVRGMSVLSASGVEVGVELDEIQKFRIEVKATRELQTKQADGMNRN